jgi:FtsP/CotA-like multicopper oxidase with cupredoxin domain
MRSLAVRKTKALVVLVSMAAVYTAATTMPASAVAVPMALCAKAGTLTLPGSVSVPVWGFASPTCSDPVQVPGPVLQANAGDVVTVTLTVDPSLSGHDVTFELPGSSVTDLGSGQYEFTASEGTFTYQSPGDAGRQTAMGLYGALVVQPSGAPTGVRDPCVAGAGTAYGAGFDSECVLVLSQLDPAFNATPDTFDMTNYLATYWLINGKAYPDTDPIVEAAGNAVLLRYVNAGYDNTAMSLLGAHEHVIARDAHALNNAFDADAETIPGGGTEDAIVTVPSFAAPTANGFPLFNRNLHVANGLACLSTNPCVPDPNYSPGGMLTFIQP